MMHTHIFMYTQSKAELNHTYIADKKKKKGKHCQKMAVGLGSEGNEDGGTWSEGQLFVMPTSDCLACARLQHEPHPVHPRHPHRESHAYSCPLSAPEFEAS